MDELNVINNNYLRGIKSLYTWKILVPERLRSGSYSHTLPNTLADTLADTVNFSRRRLEDDTVDSIVKWVNLI